VTLPAWLVSFSKARRRETMIERLAKRDPRRQQWPGCPPFKHGEDTHKMAEANRAFAHYRW